MRLVVLAALAALSADPAFPAQDRFGLSLAGVSLGLLTVGGERSGGDYEAAVAFETRGLAGILDYALDGSATGRQTPEGGLLPQLFTGVSRSPRASRHTRIDWADRGQPFVAVDPPRDAAVDPRKGAGALDPASALLKLDRPGRLDALCGTSLDIFDGSRLVRLTLYPAATGVDGVVCEGLYTRLGGEPLTPIDPPECPFTLVYRHDPDGSAVLVRIRIPTRFGDASMEKEA